MNADRERRLGQAAVALGLLLLAASCKAPPSCPVPVVSPALAGMTATLDQCYERHLNYTGTDYTFRIYYTEIQNPGDLAQCQNLGLAPSGCNHTLSDQDDANGDNTYAVALGTDLEQAFLWQNNRLMPVLDAGKTILTVYVRHIPIDSAEGYTNHREHFFLSNSLVSSPEVLRMRSAVYHEMHHLGQLQYVDMFGKGFAFSGEGIAHAIEDRVDPQVDADGFSRFRQIVEQQVLASEANRTSDLASLTAPSLLWWTWLMDQYTKPFETGLVKGWGSLREFYVELASAADELTALETFLAAKGSSFAQDFVDYTLAMYAYPFHPANPRLDFLDEEIHQNIPWGVIGHNVIQGGGYGTELPVMDPRSVRYWEFRPASQCEFLKFTFSGNGLPYAFSVMTVDNDTLISRWTSLSSSWSRSLYSANLDRAVGVVTSYASSGTVGLERGCVGASLEIESPNAAQPRHVGLAASPQNFIVRVKVHSGGESLAGLLASDFSARLRESGGSLELPAQVLNGVYVQGDYWLMVRAPNAAEGAVTGQTYDVLVDLGSLSDAEPDAVVYDEVIQDTVVVVDHSGSMGFSSGKMEAAINAANLLINELADVDQGGLVVFDETPSIGGPLQPVNSGAASHRESLLAYLASVVSDGETAIGGGMEAAADLHDAGGVATHPCRFILLSDGQETTELYWKDVKDEVLDNGCSIHAIALGPEADETLMQQIASSSVGGSYDFADNSGSVPLSSGSMGWENNLARIYDYKAGLAAGRQQVITHVGSGLDEQAYLIPMDGSGSGVVIALAWNDPSAGPTLVELLNPNGVVVAGDAHRISPQGTNEVWELESPEPGTWTLRVQNLVQEHFVSVSAITDNQLHVFAGSTSGALAQGGHAPILASFTGRDAPIVGAQVVATVVAPDGGVKNLTLWDDGNHGDSLADDGVYANVYTKTIGAEQVASGTPVEGSELPVTGSYQVRAVAELGNIRREAQTSFVVAMDVDMDGDGLPDGWEATFGADDPGGDLDGDSLSNLCEYLNGTDPRNSDTDGGGESDGSEAPGCPADGDQDPLDPQDDQVGRLRGVVVLAASYGPLHLLASWGDPGQGSLVVPHVKPPPKAAE